MADCNEQRLPESLAQRLHAEMRWAAGEVPSVLQRSIFDDGHLVIADNEFLFLTPAGNRFHYRTGRGLVVERAVSTGASDDFEIFFWGTVFGGVAWMNRYFALHASAVQYGDRLVAFTADSGGGKSTLAAALAVMGRPHVCDDTLALARSDRSLVGVPDGKPLKLWDDAARHLDAEVTGRVEAVPGKFFARPAVAGERTLPLSDLVLLERSERLSIERIAKPSDALAVVAAALYRPTIAAALGDRSGHADWMMDIVRTVRIWRLFRPLDRLLSDQFASIDRLIAKVTESERP